MIVALFDPEDIMREVRAKANSRRELKQLIC